MSDCVPMLPLKAARYRIVIPFAELSPSKLKNIV